jgi:hypothetical protein
MPGRARTDVDIAADCACGAVRMAVRGRLHAMFLCACEDCQKATGAGHSAVAIADPAEVTVTGETRAFAREAASGATFTRHFCPTCGTPLFGRSSRAPDAIMLPVGFFAGQNDWFTPSQLIFARSHRGWDLVADHLPRHETYRNSGAL